MSMSQTKFVSTGPRIMNPHPFVFNGFTNVFMKNLNDSSYIRGFVEIYYYSFQIEFYWNATRAYVLMQWTILPLSMNSVSMYIGLLVFWGVKGIEGIGIKNFWM